MASVSLALVNRPVSAPWLLQANGNTNNKGKSVGDLSMKLQTLPSSIACVNSKK